MDGTMSNTGIVSLLLLLMPILQLLVAQPAAAAANEGLDPNSWQPCSLRDATMDPTYEKRYGVYVVWQIPLNPKGIIFMVHGLSMDPMGYFDPGPKCEQCYGLPEERAVVLEALRRGYAVISVKGRGDCYDTMDKPLEASEDLVLLTTIIEEWSREHSLESLPLVAWGHSAGTSMASALTTTLPMGGLVLMSGQGLLEVVEMASPSSHPPTMFAYMPIDVDDPTLNVTGKDAFDMAVLTERGVRVAEAQTWPKPIHPLFFTERILCMSDEMSRKVFTAYEAAGWLDSSGFLTISPGKADWEAVLWEAKALPFCVVTQGLCLVRHVREELRVAFASHSFTSGTNDVIFGWLDSTIWPSSGAGSLVQFA